MLSEPIVLKLPPDLQMTDDQFFEFCQVNRDLRIESNKLVLDNPETISKDPVLPGFILNLAKVW